MFSIRRPTLPKPWSRWTARRMVFGRCSAGGVGKSISSRIQSVWYRRPGEFVLSDKLEAVEDKWLRLECQHLFRGVWGSLRARWVSNPAAIRQASLKPLQLQLATELGFDVPRFTITNDVDHAASFVKAC